MNLTARGKKYSAIVCLSALFSYLIITLNFFPHLGFALTISTFLIFSYIHKKDKSKDTKLYLALALAFSVFLFVRSEPVITFFNLLAALFFGLLTLVSDLKNGMGFLDYIYANASFVISSIITKKSDYYLEFKQTKGNANTFKVIEIVAGSLLTLILLAVVLPLLSSVNPFFQKIIEDIWSFLNLEKLLTRIGFENVFIWPIRVIFFLVFIFLIPKALTLINTKINYKIPISINTEYLPLIIPKVVLALVLIVFFITQLTFYFASDTMLTNIGVSHSERTREVFAQLSLVSGIILLLIYNSGKKEGYGKLVNWVLGVQGIFLTLIAYKSVFDYVNAWGLTYKRLYGFTFATWIVGVFILLFINHRGQNSPFWFVKKTIIFSAILLLFVNIFNFDYLIYHFGKSETGQGVDYTYLSTLSADSLSYKEQFLKLEEATSAGDYSLDFYDNENPLIILHKIEHLQKKYSKFDFRVFNLLDFLQYEQIKTIDTKELRSFYTDRLYPQRSF